MIRKRLKPWVLITITIICLIGIVCSSYEIILWKINTDTNKKIKKEINEKIRIRIEDKETTYDIDFSSLKEKNPDTIAYLKVNNTNIDYIVVKGTNNSYYLKHNFNKEYNIAGWIFADYHNKFDETDKNIVIYGHDTKDGSMFGTLKKVLENEFKDDEDNLVITLITEQKEYKYQIFSTYIIKPEDYYINTVFNDTEYSEFLNTIKSRSNYNYNIELDSTDKILTLSSCTADGKKRVVVHAKLIDSHSMSSE